MIDLSRIRSLKKLTEIKNTLTEFLQDPTLEKVYIENFHWGIEDLEADREAVIYLLEKVEARFKSLSKYLNRLKEKQEK